MRILQNAAKCLNCQQELVAPDDPFLGARCPCGNVTIYGGKQVYGRTVMRGDFFEEQVEIDLDEEAEHVEPVS